VCAQVLLPALLVDKHGAAAHAALAVDALRVMLDEAAGFRCVFAELILLFTALHLCHHPQRQGAGGGCEQARVRAAVQARAHKVRRHVLRVFVF
jgi:hypothetical protein